MKNKIGRIFLRREKSLCGEHTNFYVTKAIAVGDRIQGIAGFKDGTCQIFYIGKKVVYASGQNLRGDANISRKIGELFVWKESEQYENMPTQKSLEEGLFVVDETVVISDDCNLVISKIPRVTLKGQAYLLKKLLGETSDTEFLGKIGAK